MYVSYYQNEDENMREAGNGETRKQARRVLLREAHLASVIDTLVWHSYRAENAAHSQAQRHRRRWPSMKPRPI